MKNKTKILDVVGGLFAVILFSSFFIAVLYYCEIKPMSECMDSGHSFWYCWRLFSK